MANGLHALALAAAVALLLMGCVSEPKPTEGMQGLVVQNAEGVIDEVQPAKPPATGNPQGATELAECTLAVKQPAVVAGEQADVSINARFAGSAIFDLACGDESRRLLSENTLALETKCRFSTPGTSVVVLKANGHECANATIEVRKKAGGRCSINNASIKRDLAAFYYEWTVNFDGFSDGDVLTWACGNTVSRKTLSSDPVWGMPRLDTLSCDFPSQPSADYISVSISGVQCGTVSTR